MNLRATAKAHRLAEVAQVSGLAIVAVPFAVSRLQDALTLPALLATCGMLAFYLAIWEFNSWLGHEEDRLNPRLNEVTRKRRDVYLWVAVGGFVGALLSFGSQQPQRALWLVASFLLWGAYSWPRIGLKSMPIAGTLVHVITGSVHFLLVYSAVAPPAPATTILSLYFALLFASGHLFHEVLDHDADLAAGLRTGAVRWGKRNGLVGAIGVVGVAFSIGVGLVVETGERMLLPFLAANVAHTASMARILFGSRSTSAILMAQRWYRRAYLVAGGAALAWIGR